MAGDAINQHFLNPAFNFIKIFAVNAFNYCISLKRK